MDSGQNSVKNADLWGPGALGRGIVLGVAAVLLAGIATRDAAVQSLARSNPAMILNLDPGNDRALNLLYRRSITSKGLSQEQRRAWATRARTGLRTSPLSAPFLRMVGDDPTIGTHADTVLALAEQISRRDSLLQLMLIERSAKGNRVEDALSHYNRALSVSPDLREALFPIMATALHAPRVYKGLALYATRPWMPAFLDFAIARAPSAEGVAGLLAGIANTPGGKELASGHQAALAGRLVAQGDYPAARALAIRAAGPQAPWIDHVGIAHQTWMTAVRPLTWATAESEGVDARLETDSSILASAGPGDSGLAFYRVLMPAPGRWRFSASATAPSDGTVPAAGRWELFCLRAPGHPSTALGELPMDPQRNGKAELAFDVPTDCPAVRISFTIENGDGGSQAGVILSNVALDRAQPEGSR